MSLQSTISIDLPETQLPPPKIIWPTVALGEADDLDKFPDEPSYRERHHKGMGGVISPTFRNAVRLAQHRFWIFDPQVLRDPEPYERLGELFYETGAWDLRIITTSKGEAEERAAWLKSLEADLQTHVSSNPTSIKIFLRPKPTNQMPDIHDRFAIIDDVLWHCGATVGGLHRAINAMTFGWSAKATNAIQFFNHLCDDILDEYK